MQLTSFLAVFFGRAASTVRAKYGDAAYIDVSGKGNLAIRDERGHLLGAGRTLRDAMTEADKRLAQVRIPDAETQFPCYVDTDVVLDTDDVRT